MRAEAVSPEPQKPHVAAGPRYDPPPTTRTTHRYSDTNEHPVSECSPERCGGDPAGWKGAVDPNKH